MSDAFKAFLLGIVEGLTEFFPVSSTGHLILAGHVLSFPESISGYFEVSIQLGAIAAVVVLYRRDFLPFLHPRSWTSPLFINLICVTLPALVAGIVFYDAIKSFLFNPIGVAIALIIGALGMLFADSYQQHTQKPITHISQIGPKQALVIGLAQCVSLWPGMSRSASTMMGGLFAKLDYPTAAKFSFMAAVPVMVAAVSYDLSKNSAHIDTQALSLIGIGMGTAFLVSILGIKTLLKLLHTYGFKPFAYYRIGLGLLILALYFL